MKSIDITIYLFLVLTQVSCMPQEPPHSYSGKVIFREMDNEIIFRIKTNLSPEVYIFTHMEISFGNNEVLTIYFDKSKMEVIPEGECLNIIFHEKPKREIKGKKIWIYLSVIKLSRRELYKYEPSP